MIFAARHLPAIPGASPAAALALFLIVAPVVGLVWWAW